MLPSKFQRVKAEADLPAIKAALKSGQNVAVVVLPGLPLNHLEIALRQKLLADMQLNDLLSDFLRVLCVLRG